MSRRSFLAARMFSILLLIAVAFGTAPRAAAQSGNTGLSLSARPAFDGYFKYGEWLPVWVELENSGPDLSGEVRIQVRGSGGVNTYAAPVDLPSTSRKSVPVYVLPNNFTRELVVELVSQDKVVASQKVAVKPQANITYIAGLLAAERGALSLLSGVKLPGQERPKMLIDLTLADLPERLEGLRSFDLLVLNDVDTSTMTPAQAAALESWVFQGGRLVIGGGPGAQRTAAGLPQTLLPLLPSGETEIDAAALAGLEKYAGADPVKLSGPFVLATGEPGVGHNQIASGDIPLLREAAFGSGYVDFSALDLSSAPFDAWSGAPAFWEKLVSPGAAYPDWLPPDMSARQQRSGQLPAALANLPMLDLPSARGLTLLLAVYILLVGPANYFFLRSRKRLHWAWFTIPLITLVFSAGAFVIGYALRGVDLVLNKIALIELQPSGSATVTTYMGLFSPARSAYEIEVPGSGLLSPVSAYMDPWAQPSGVSGGEMIFVQDDPGSLRGLTVNQWSMQSFMTEGTWDDFGQISSDLRLAGDVLTGTVRNDTAYPLEDAVLILGRQFTRLGDLAPGAQAEVNLNLANLTSQSFGPPLSYRLFEQEFNNPGPTGISRETDMKRMIIESTLEQGSGMLQKLSSRFIPPAPGSSPLAGQSPLLIAWLDQAPPQVRVAGRGLSEQATGLLYTPLAYSLPDSGQLSLPPGLVPGRLVEMPREGGVCGDASSTSIYISNGEAVFDFQLPVDSTEYQVDQLKLALWTDGGWWRSPDTSIYNWENESWSTLAGLIQGVNVIPEAAPMVGEDGLVRVRLAGSNNNLQGCFYLALGLEASRQPGQGGG